jgi:subtilisin family serine protease
MKKVFIIAALLFVVCALGSHPKIVPEVFNNFDFIAEQKTNVMILLKEQVNFDNLRNMNGVHVNSLSWDERGRVVLEAVSRLAKITQAPIIKILEENNISYRSMYVVNAIFADRVPLDVMEKIAERNDVFQIQANHQVDTDLEETEYIENGPSNDIEWNIKIINATYLWDKGFYGQGMVVGNSDTGATWTHPALKHNYRGVKSDGSVDHNYSWYDPAGQICKAPCDQDSHGTHTIGTSVGGVDRKIGIAPQARWIACRSIKSSTNVEAMLGCLQFFLAPHDMNKMNPKPELRPISTGHSYGCRTGSTACRHESWKQAVKALKASGQFVVASAGNAGSRCKTVRGPPGKLDSVFTVGALNKEAHTITTFSSRGPTVEENKRKPDICAGGANVISAVPTGGYGAKSGTSMSCPAVNGAIALLWSALPELKGQVELTQKIIEETARHQTDKQCDDGKTPNNVYGYGTIDVGAAYERAKELLKKN